MHMSTRLLAVLTVAGLLAVAVPAAAHAQFRGFGGWAPEVGADAVDTIGDLEVDQDAMSPDGDGSGDQIHIGFTSKVAQHVTITALDVRGNVVRTIADAELPVGTAAYAWNGATDQGAPLADGEYELVVEAGAGADSESVSDTVVIDRAAPTVTTTTSTVSVSSPGAASFRLPVNLSESALVDVTTSGEAGRAHAVTARVKGRSSITVPIGNRAALRRALATGSADVRVRLLATDDAGNATVRSVDVDLDYDAPVAGPPAGDPGTGSPTTPVAGSGKLAWPVSAPITSRFGQRWGRLHAGLDLGASSGTRIGSAGAGRVVYAGWMSGYGNCVMVDHGGGIVTLYGHQSRIATKVGATVTRGQTLGYVGSTGNSTGPHLHFEVRVNGSPKDPIRYLP
ncbi:MAG: Peptidase, family [Thermoleophilia bacterium]|nr:Peptidase, family [Thermoleophilia bacterium]